MTRRTAVRATGVVAAMALAAGAPAPAQAGQAVAQFTAIGTVNWVVPAGVTQLTVDLAGQAGQKSGSGIAGGVGATVSGAIPTVVPGTPLTLFIGQGGGAGGTAATSGGAGGGFTGLAAAGNMLAIAAGGGGGGGGSSIGGIGGAAGIAGVNGANLGGTAAVGGGAGTVGNPGAGGTAGVTASGTSGSPGLSGAANVGGKGGNGSSSVGGGGGGGGAGVFGGGGGGGVSSPVLAGAGGGGGSSAAPGLTSATIGVGARTPSVTLAYNDPVAPTLSLAAPGANPTAITGTAGKDTGDASTITLAFFRGVATTGAPDATFTVSRGADGTFTTPPPFLPDGTWTVRAQQTDLGANTSSATRTFVVDRSAPAVTLTGPDTSRVATPTITGELGAAEGDLPAVTVTIRAADGTVTPTTVAINGTSFTATPDAPLERGTYGVTATQQDAHGHTGTATRLLGIDIPVVLAAPVTPVATPTPTPTSTPAPPKAAAALKITSARATRKGRTTTVRLAGTAAPAATGAVRITVKGAKAAATGTLSRGAWAATLRVTTKPGKAAKRLTISVAYAGDQAFLPAQLTRSVTPAKGR